MINHLRRLLAPPIFADEEKTRIAQILNVFLWSAISILLFLIFVRIMIWTENGYGALFVLAGIVIAMIGGLVMTHRGHVYGASILIVISSWCILTYQVWMANGIRDVAVSSYIVVLIFASLLLGWRYASVVGGLSLISIWCLAITEKLGMRTFQAGDPINYARDLSFIIILIGVLIYLLITSWSRTLQSSRLELQERLRAEEKLQRQADYLFAMNEISLGLLNRFELRPLLDSIVRRACRLLEAEHGMVELALPDGSALRQEVGYGSFAKHTGTFTMRDEGLAGSVWNSGKTLIVHDYSSWEKRLPEGVDAGYTAVVGIPLKVGSGMVIGVLVIAHTEEKRTFSQEQLNLLERFAALASLAIDNVRLYETAQTELQERRNTEVALQENEGRTRAILNAIPDMIFEIAGDGTLLDFVASAELTPVQSPAYFIGKNVRDIFPAAVAEQTLFALGRALATDQLHAFEYGLPPGEETQFFEARISAVTPKSVVMMVRDISQRKWVETEREKLINELELKNSELERFTYTVSHDLKSPLITIKGFLGFLEQDAASGNLVRLKADIQRIASATDKMQILLNELLDLTRVGRLVNPYQQVSFGELAHEAVELVQGRIQSREIQISIQEDLPVVYGDRPRLIEALQNLIDNAAKFMGDQSEPRIDIGLSGYENGLPTFYIRDNGVGIELAHHDRIFGLFNKLDATSEGTGIGLALVKRIIEVHGGRIWVESEPKKGAAFLFTLQTQPAP